MRGLIFVAAAVTVALLVLGGGAIALDETKEVAGTKHDVTPPGVVPCTSCHIPRDSEGELLWAADPNSGGPLSGQKNLCFSCHDGTVTGEGMYAFSTDRTMHVRDAGVSGRDCDLCHDPHGAGYERFLKVPGHANFCQSCHERAGAEDHPVDVDSRAAGVEPKDSTWDPNHGDFVGTRLWNAEGTGPGDFVKCLTCHATHGGEPGTDFNTMPVEASHQTFLPLCMNCHYEWGGD